MPKARYWHTLSHNGVLFTPTYRPSGLRLKFKGNWLTLSPLAEEMAYAWAKKKDTPYVKDQAYADNFWKDFSRQLPEGIRSSSLSEIGFEEFNAAVDAEKHRKEAYSKEEKKRIAAERKKTREAMKEKYGYAYIDGEKVEIQTYVVEPPGIFQGRGSHPMRGRWKPRTEEADVILNLDSGALVPPGKWGKVVHEPSCMWLASWVDELSGKVKYVWPHESSFLAQEKNKSKYDKARKLEQGMPRVRRKIDAGLRSRDLQARKIATVCFLIDRLCMRVGDEKDEDEADTVGATTLRVEHVKLQDRRIDFDFLGKDSVQWLKSLENVEPQVIANFREFVRGKKAEELIFDGVNSARVNSYLSSIVPGLSAKVFRTYHATNVVRDYLASVDDKANTDDVELDVYYAKMANLKAAILCNHKRTPPKSWDESLKKKEELVKMLRSVRPSTPKQEQTHKRRLRKAELALDLARQTRDYNLTTSLKNYIDPRVYKAWADHLSLDWQVLYPKTMQRKFGWANKSKLEWMTISVAHA